MSIIFKLLPIILVSIIFYLLMNDLYPKYQELINLTKNLNELQNKEKKINELERLIRAFSENPNIQQLVTNREVLDLWLPLEPKIEYILAFLAGIYQINNLTFQGTEFNIVNEPKVYNQNILPVRIIEFSLQAELNKDNLISFIDNIEKSSRLMVIKQAKIFPDDKSSFLVESYYLSEK